MNVFMKKHKLQAGKRFLALLLAVAMVTGGIPANTVSAAESNAVADVVEAQPETVSSVEAYETTETGNTTATTDGSEVGEPAEIELYDLDEFGNNSITAKEINGRWIISKQYDEKSANPFETILESLMEVSNDYIEVSTKDDGNDTDLESQLTFQWQQKGADGSYVAMSADAVPHDAGEYQLVISIDKKFAVADPVSVDFVIKQKKLYVTYDNTLFDEVMDSGNTVKEIKESLVKAWGLSDTAGGEIEERYKAFVNEPVITVRETFGAEEAAEGLADETVLKMGADYNVKITVSAKEQHQLNYEIVQRDMINLRITELVDTYIEITNNRMENGADLIRQYNGEAVAAPSTDGEDAEITVKVFSEEKDPVTDENLEIVPAEGALNFYWEDANGEPLESAPVDAGAYYYKAVYTDAEGIYASASEKIRVVVEPAALAVRPVLGEENTFFAGNSAQAVLQNVSYGLYPVAADGTYGTEYTEYDKNTFWGVSYNNSEKVYSYSPVFKVQMGQTTTTKIVDKTDAKAEPKTETKTVWSDVSVLEHPSDVPETETIDEENTTTYITTSYSYRVVFSGKKGLYENGVATSLVDVNTAVNYADTNHTIDLSVIEAADNIVTVNVQKNANAVIDVTQMLIGEKGNSIDNVYTKIYDGAALYPDRAEYKKAVVKDAESDTEIASGTSDSIRYTWHTYALQDAIDDKTGEVKKDASGNPVKEAVITGEVDTDYDKFPVNAGKYCLKVTYTDATNHYVAEPAYVYFEIQKQLVWSHVSGVPEIYSGTSVGNFGYSCASMMEHKLYLIPGNDITLPVESMTELTEAMDYNTQHPSSPLYTLDWTVFVGNSTNPAEAKFEEITDESKTFDAKLLYKAGAKVSFNYVHSQSAYYYNFANNYEVVENDETVIKSLYDTVDVTVKQMGDIELEVRIDDSKRGIYKKVYDGDGFDLTEAITSKYITVVKKNTDEEVPLIGENAINAQFIWEYYDDYIDEYVDSSGIKSPANANAYYLRLYFGGDETYQSLDYTFTYSPWIIEKRDLIITPAIQESIRAGLNYQRYYNNSDFFRSVVDVSKTTISGYIDADAEVFGNGYLDNAMGLVFNSWYYTLYDENGDLYYGYLRTGKEYAIKVNTYFLDEEDIWYQYKANYAIIPMTVPFTPNTRNRSDIVGTNAHSHINYGIEAITVTPIVAVPYWKNATSYEEGKTLPEGNYFQIQIQAPDEFRVEGYDANFNRFVFKNAVETAGGYIMDLDRANGKITMAFPASDKTDKSFTILWEEGYTENYIIQLSKAELMADATQAVAPKSLAFNGVNKKMVVGETQQLDVKINRVLSDDLVLLNYKVVSGTDVMTVTEDTGIVTALKPGTASVEVYPVRVNQNGEYVRIDSFKKKVVVKIKVSNVSTPKINSVKSSDTWVDISYKVPTDGYRRELYVLPGKGLKATAFESLIAESGNEKFAGQWAYVADEADYDYAYDADKNLMYWIFSGLQPNTDYTVYIRNVSAFRETADGSKVVESHTGSVKSFKTTKRQIDDLELDLTDDSYAKVKLNLDTNQYDVPLSAKTLKMDTTLIYPHKDSQEAADADDELRRPYPISKQDQLTYLNPKLEYFIIDDWDDSSEEKTSVYKHYFDGYYYKASKLATIDKKGNIKLKGVGDISVCARDTISGISYEFTSIHIYSNVTKMTAKKLTLKEGSVADIYNNLVFYDGKTKLTGVEGLREQNELLVSVSDTQAVMYSNDCIVALEPNKTVTLTIALASNPAVTTTMQVKTKTMDAVKGLKVYDVTDYDAMVSFTHTGNLYNYSTGFRPQFKVTVKDNRGDIIASYIETLGNSTRLSLNKDKSKLDKNVFAYELYLSSSKVDLVPQSSYSVSIAPLFVDSVGKAVTKKFKTTNYPASYYDIAKGKYGGARINEVNDGYSTETVYFVSGNTYTLEVSAADIARDRATDTLTWKSSNKKVGTIKANAGGFTATFKALKAGTTDIEIVSKVTKKVICRRTIVVIPVGDGTYSYGALEPVDFNAHYMENGIEPLTLGNPARFQKDYNLEVYRYYRDYFFVSFTAPFDGEFEFTKNAFEGTVQFLDDYTYSGEQRTGFDTNGDTIPMKQGETIELTMMAYFSNGNYGYKGVDFEVNVEAQKSYNRLPLGGSANSLESAYVRFVAPEDNYYTFYATKPNMTASVSVDGTGKGDINLYNEENSDYYKSNNGIGLKKGEIATLTLKNPSENYDVSAKGRVTTTLSTTAVSTGDLKKGEEKWYVYTAPITGTYTFASANATGMIKADYYSSLSNENKDYTLDQIQQEDKDTDNFSQTLKLDKGDKVVLRVYTESETAVKADISVSLPVVQSISLNEKVTLTIDEGKEAWVAFTVPKADAEYCLNYNSSALSFSVGHYLNSVDNQLSVSNRKISGKNYGLKAGDIIYLRFAITDAGAPNTNATVTLSITETTAKILTTETPDTLKVSNNGLYFYSFTAPSYGLYTIQSQVTEDAAGNHKVRACVYEAVDSSSSHSDLGSVNGANFYAEKMLATGEELIFAVEPSTTFDGETTVSIVANKAELETFTENEITLKAGESKWYQYTAKSEDSYIFSWTENNAVSVAYSAEFKENIGTTYDNGSSKELKAGSSLYFKVSNTTNAETKIQFKVTAKTPVLPDAAFTVKADVAQTYKYVLAKDGRYRVSLSVAEENVNVTLKRDGYSCADGSEFYSYAGRTITFEVKADADATVTLKVERIVPETLTDAVVTLKAGENKWFEYVVPATGRYAVSVTDADGKTTSVSAYYNEDLEYSGYNIAGLDKDWLVKGDVYYFRMNNSKSQELSAKLLVKQIAMDNLPVSTDLTSVTLNSGEEKWYKFRADETTYYNFTTELPSNVKVSYYENTDDDSYTLAADTYFVEKNVWYDIRVVRNSNDGEDAKTAKLGVVKENVSEWKEKTENPVTAKSGEKQYVKFEVPSTGYYSIIAKEIPDDVTVMLTPVSGNSMIFTKDAKYKYQKFTIGTTKNYEVTLSFTSDDAEATKSVKFVIEKIVPAELTDSLELTVDKGLRTWFVFTAPEDGRYLFSDNSADAAVECYIYEDEIKLAENETTDFPVEYALAKGEKLYMAAYYDTAKGDAELPATAKFTVTVNKIVPEVITGTVYRDTLEANSINWYSYTATEFKVYTFIFEETEGTGDGEDGTPYTVTVYDGLTDNSGTVCPESYDAAMSEGMTKYFRVENNTAEKKNFRMIVEAPVTEQLNIGGSTEITFAEKGTKWLSGVITESAFYQVIRKDGASSVNKVSMYLESKDNAEIAVTGDDVYWLEKGDKVSAIINGDASDSTKLLFEKVETVSAPGDKTVTLKEDGVTYLLYEITKADTYYISRYDGVKGFDYVCYYYNFSKEEKGNYLTLGNGGPTNCGKQNVGSYVLVRLQGDAGASTDLSVYLRTYDYAGIIECGDSVGVTVVTGRGYWFTFTAPADGDYKFYSTGSQDTWAELKNTNGSQLKSDDDSGEGSNFLINYTMKEGETIQYCVHKYNWGSGSFTVHVEEAE